MNRAVDPDPIRIQGFDDQKKISFIFFCNLLMSKLQEKPSALKREHPTLQKMKFINFFLCLWVIFALLDPDPIQIRIRIQRPHWTRIRTRIQIHSTVYKSRLLSLLNIWSGSTAFLVNLLDQFQDLILVGFDGEPGLALDVSDRLVQDFCLGPRVLLLYCIIEIKKKKTLPGPPVYKYWSKEITLAPQLEWPSNTFK